MFSSRLLLNIGLIVFLAILLSIALFNEEDESLNSSFSSLNIKQINSVDIDYKGSTTSIRKQNDTWKIISPVAVEADNFRVDAILNLLANKTAEYYQINETDLQKYSLNPAKAKLRLNQQEFLFGSTSAINNKRYVFTNNKLFLIEDTVYPLITSAYTNLMRRQLFTQDTKIQEVIFNNNSVKKNKNGSWETNNKNISSDTLHLFINNWQHIQAYAVYRKSDTVKSNGMRVVINTKDQQSIVRIVEKTDVNTIVIDPELKHYYQFDITAYESLTNPEYFIPKTDNENDNHKSSNSQKDSASGNIK